MTFLKINILPEMNCGERVFRWEVHGHRRGNVLGGGYCAKVEDACADAIAWVKNQPWHVLLDQNKNQ
jgi:hypothetical protein